MAPGFSAGGVTLELVPEEHKGCCSNDTFVEVGRRAGTWTRLQAHPAPVVCRQRPEQPRNVLRLPRAARLTLTALLPACLPACLAPCAPLQAYTISFVEGWANGKGGDPAWAAADPTDPAPFLDLVRLYCAGASADQLKAAFSSPDAQCPPDYAPALAKARPGRPAGWLLLATARLLARQPCGCIAERGCHCSAAATMVAQAAPRFLSLLRSCRPDGAPR